MTNDDLVEFWKLMTEHAGEINAHCTPDPAATPFYESWSGALVWTDEKEARLPPEVSGYMRFVYAYRTKIMLGELGENEDNWQRLLQLFPNWIGFLHERRTPTPELLAVYRRGDVSLRWCLRQMERDPNWMSGE